MMGILSILSAITILSWIATVSSLAGNYFVNRKNTIGLYIWTFGSVLWASIAIATNNTPQLIMFGTYTLFNIDGIMKWRKDDKNVPNKLNPTISEYEPISAMSSDNDDTTKCYKRILPNLSLYCVDKYYATSEDIYNILSYSGKILTLYKQSMVDIDGRRINYYVHEESGYMFYDDMVTVEYIVNYIDFIKDMPTIIRYMKDYEYNVKIYDTISDISNKLIYKNRTWYIDNITQSELAVSIDLFDSLFIVYSK